MLIPLMMALTTPSAPRACSLGTAAAAEGEGTLMGMAGGGKASAAEVLARMSAGLKPVEAYAVRLLEELHPVDVEGAAKKAIDELKVCTCAYVWGGRGAPRAPRDVYTQAMMQCHRTSAEDMPGVYRAAQRPVLRC